jgi:hypothetical protein
VTLYWSHLIQHDLQGDHANGGVMQLPTGSRKVTSLLAFLLLSGLVLSGCSRGTPTAVAPVQPVAKAIVTMNVTPASVMPGQSATLTWTTSNATSCTASGAWSGARSASGSSTVQLQGASAQAYTLVCSGTGLPGKNSVTLNAGSEQGACAAHAAVRAHGKRASRGKKPVGARL